MYSGIGKGIDALFKFMAGTLLVSVPLALWKLIDIAIWVFNNVHIGIK